MRIKIVVVVSVMLVAFQPAFSQEGVSVAEVSAGYSFLRDFDLHSNGHGWIGALGLNLNSKFAVWGEVSGIHGLIDAPSGCISCSPGDGRVHSFMGGPQFTLRTNPRVTPFVHVFLGGARRGSAGQSATDLAMQLGGGTDFWLRSGLGVRIGGDYRHIFADLDATDAFRFQSGLVFRFGRR